MATLWGIPSVGFGPLVLTLCIGVATGLQVWTPDIDIFGKGYSSFGVNSGLGDIALIAGKPMDVKFSEANADGCKPFSPSLAGKDFILLVERGGCFFADKVANAQHIGAALVIVANSLNSLFQNNNASSAGYLSTTQPCAVDCNLGDGPNCEASSACQSSLCANFTSNVSFSGPVIHKQCCVNDHLLQMFFNTSFASRQHIPALHIGLKDGQHLRDTLTLNPGLRLTIKIRPTTPVILTDLLLWLVGVSVCIFGSFYGAKEIRAKEIRQRVFVRDSSPALQQQESSTTDMREIGESEIEAQVSNDSDNYANCIDSSGCNKTVEEKDNEENAGGCINANERNVEIEDTAMLDEPPSNETCGDSEDGIVEQESSSVSLRQSSRTLSDQQYITLWSVVGMVVFASIVLVVLYFLIQGGQMWIYVLIDVFFCFAGWTSVILVLGIPCSEALLNRINKERVLCNHRHTGPIKLSAIIGSVLSLIPAVMWLVLRDFSFAWVLQDFLGGCLCFNCILLIKVPSFRVAALLLSAMLVYDVFYTFVSPLLTGEGNSVMVVVATGQSAAAVENAAQSCEILTTQQIPMVFRIPTMDYRKSYTLLGLGDVVFPGFLLAFAVRFDTVTRGGPFGKKLFPSFRCCGSLRYDNTDRSGLRSGIGYSPVLWIGYGFGLFITQLANFMGWTFAGVKGQPALMYLVPITCLALTIFAAIRGELREMWSEKNPTRPNGKSYFGCCTPKKKASVAKSKLCVDEQPLLSAETQNNNAADSQDSERQTS